MQMEELVHDLPFPIYLEHREHGGEAMAYPVVEFQPHDGDRAGVIDKLNYFLKLFAWAMKCAAILSEQGRRGLARNAP